jgi:hypothetical protein
MTWLDDLQRRLAIAGARGIGQQIAGQVSKAIRGEPDDVWGAATTEPEGAVAEPPECAWCPVCRAIRLARSSNPDLAGRVGETAEALMSSAHDVVVAVDAAFTKTPRQPTPLSPDRPDATAEPQEHAPAREGTGAAPGEPQAPAARAASQERTAPSGPTASASQEPPGTAPSPNGQRA